MLKELRIGIWRKRLFLITHICKRVIGMVQLGLFASDHPEKVVRMKFVEVVDAIVFW